VCISEVEVRRRSAAVSARDAELLPLQLTWFARRRAYTIGSSVIDHVLSADPPWIIARWKRFRPTANTR